MNRIYRILALLGVVCAVGWLSQTTVLAQEPICGTDTITLTSDLLSQPSWSAIDSIPSAFSPSSACGGPTPWWFGGTCGGPTPGLVLSTYGDSSLSYPAIRFVVPIEGQFGDVSAVDISFDYYWSRSRDSYPLVVAWGDEWSLINRYNLYSQSANNLHHVNNLHYAGDVNHIAFYLQADRSGEWGMVQLSNLQIVLHGGDCPSPPTTPCSTVDNADFQSDETWTLSGTAAISNSALSLSVGDYAQTSAITVSNYNQYAITMDIAGVVTPTVVVTDNGGAVTSNLLEVSLGDNVDAVRIDSTGVYTAIIDYSPSVIQWGDGAVGGGAIPSPYLTLEMLSGGVDIDYICIAQVGGYTSDCLGLISNPDFATADDWQFTGGSYWNDVGKNGMIAYVPGSLPDDAFSYSNLPQDITNAFISSLGLTGPVPELTPGQYLILSFDARTLGGDTALTSVYHNNVLNNRAVAMYSASVYDTWYTYETPFDLFAGEQSDVELMFFNNGDLVDGNDAIYLDNLCVFVSDDAPQVPYLSGDNTDDDDDTTGWGDDDPGSSGPVLLSCGDVSYWLYSVTGVNFPELEAEEYELSIDPTSWVPWLASRLWRYVGKPISCTIFASSPGRILANFITFVIATIAGFVGWLGTAFATMGRWFDYLGDMIRLGAQGAFIQALNGLNGVLTFLGNGLSAVAGGVSDVIETGVQLWNTSIVPFFSDVWSTVKSMAGLVGGIVSDVILAGVRGAIIIGQTVWMFLHGAFSTPLTFYHAFDGAVNNSAYELIPTCNQDPNNPWCRILFGFEIINHTTSHTITYPIVIVGIIVATVGIFWRNIWELFTIRIQ